MDNFFYSNEEMESLFRSRSLQYPSRYSLDDLIVKMKELNKFDSEIDSNKSIAVGGNSGKLLDLDAEPDAYAKTIVSWVNNQDLYNKLVLGARRHYEENGNWELLINRFIHETKQIMQH